MSTLYANKDVSVVDVNKEIRNRIIHNKKGFILDGYRFSLTEIGISHQTIIAIPCVEQSKMEHVLASLNFLNEFKNNP